jgi:hypothetical protein
MAGIFNMVRNYLKGLLLYSSILMGVACNGNKLQKECCFNFRELKPCSTCNDGIKVITEYDGTSLRSVKFERNNRLIKRDTVLAVKGTEFFLSDIKLQLNKLYRISARISDTSRIFVFNKDSSNYKIAYIENYLNDSTIDVQFVWRSKLRPLHFTYRTLDSLLSFREYVTFFREHIKVEYRYSNSILYFKIIEDYANWKSENALDSLSNIYGNIYLDMELLEDKGVLPYL